MKKDVNNERELYWQWENLLNASQIKNLNKVIKNNLDLDGFDNPANTTKSSKVEFCLYKDLKPYLHDLLERVKLVNKEHFGYSLYDVNDYDRIHINTYSSKNKGRYDWHVDAARTWVNDLKFTVLINISEKKYDGGSFFLFKMGPMEVTSLSKPGTMLMFQSWVPHRVLPVISGSRKTIAIFVKGPRFV